MSYNNNNKMARQPYQQQRNNRFGGGNRNDNYRGGRGGGRMNDTRPNNNNHHGGKPEPKKDIPSPSPAVEKPAANQPNLDNSVEEKKPEKKPPMEKKTRLFVGNLASGTNEDDFRKIFSEYGQLSEVFVHSDKGFAFVRLDTRANAEKAKSELDGKQVSGRALRVRYATSGASLSVKNLSPMVSNELLEEAFAKFGQIERAVVIVDDKGRSTTRGIVEFTRKGSAQKAIQQIKEGCFLITSSPRVISVAMMEQEDSEDGLPEKSIVKTPHYYSEREAPPRFAVPGTFEEQYAKRWKALDDLEREQREQLERSVQASREKLESEMENCMHEHQAMLMKQDLLRRQEELERLEEQRKRELERRQQLEMARMDAHNKEMAERQHRQEILRAQIEGTYKNDYSSHHHAQVTGLSRDLKMLIEREKDQRQQQRGGGSGDRRSGGQYGRNSSPATSGQQQVDHLKSVHDQVIKQGGLAPAPSRFDQRNEYASKLASSGGNGVGGSPGGQQQKQPPQGGSRGGQYASQQQYHRQQYHHQQPQQRRAYPDEYPSQGGAAEMKRPRRF